MVWITGGGSGLGKHMALQFAEDGARVAVSGRRPDRLEEVVDAIRAAGGEAMAVVCDVTEEPELEAAVDSVVDAWGQLDVVVANAGVSISGPVEKLTMADWQRQFNVNVCAAAMTAAKALPHLERSRGRLALVGSVAAMVHFPRAAPYQASKAAVVALGGSLSAELAPRGVTCTTIHPGFVDSEIYKVGNAGEFKPERKDPRPAALIWDTDDAARVMCRAIHRRKREYVFTGHGRLGWFLGRHFPGLVHQMTRRMENKASKA